VPLCQLFGEEHIPVPLCPSLGEEAIPVPLCSLFGEEPIPLPLCPLRTLYELARNENAYLRGDRPAVIPLDI
jgi:hypothetical protein